MIMIRDGVLSDEAKNTGDIGDYIKSKLDSMKTQPTCSWFLVLFLSGHQVVKAVMRWFMVSPTATHSHSLRIDLLLPSEHPAVVRDKRKRQSRKGKRKYLGEYISVYLK